MRKEIRNVMALSASVVLVALTGCGALTGTDGGGDDGEEAREKVEEVPALSDIDSQMWDSMTEAGTVTMTIDATEFADSDPQSAEMFGQMLDADVSEMQFYGSLNETATGMRIGEEDLLRYVGDDGVYISAGAIFNILEGQDLGLSDQEQQEFDDVAAQLSGKWFDYSSEIQTGDGTENIDIAVLFDDLRKSWDGEEAGLDSPVDREQITDEGTHEVRDGQDVWVYTGSEEGDELVVEANHEAPTFVSISGNDASVGFSDWGETEAPQQPDEADIMTQDDLQQQIGGSGSTSGDSGMTEPDTEPSDTSGLNSDSSSGTNRVNIPGVGTVDCSGSVPGDPGVSTLGDGYTYGDLMKIYDACDRPGEPTSAMDNEEAK